MKKYTILQTIPTTYLAAGGRVVNGWVVHVNLTKWNEVHILQVPSLDPTQVDKEISDLYTKREALDKLGDEK